MPAFVWLVECETAKKIQKGPLERQEDKRGQVQQKAVFKKSRFSREGPKGGERGFVFICFKIVEGNRQRLKVAILMPSTFKAQLSMLTETRHSMKK